MNTQEPQAALRYRLALLNRLLALYLEDAVFPGNAEEPTPLTLSMVQRLYQCVLTEGYGQ